MRIKSIEFDNFRVYKETTTFKIEDKNIILLYGNNGYGKTSFFDGIEWGITGEISRYKRNGREKKDYPILTNYFNKSLEGAVSINFNDSTVLKRKSILKKSNGINEGELVGDLGNLLIESITNPESKLEKQFTLSHLLCQETINSFVRETDEKKRYENFLSLYGFTKNDTYKSKIKDNISVINKLHSEVKNEIMGTMKKILDLKSGMSLLDNTVDLNLIEEKLKKYFKTNVLNLKKYEKDLEEKLNELSYSIKIEEEKEAILKKASLYEQQIGKIKLMEEIKLILKELEKDELLKDIERNKVLYLKYIELAKSYDFEEHKKNILSLELEKIESLKEIDQIVIFLNSKDMELEKINTHTELQSKFKEIDIKIEKFQNFKETISELSSKFFLASKTLLEKNQDLNICPLCENSEFDRKKILTKLENELESSTSPQFIEIENNITSLLKEKVAFKKTKKNIEGELENFFISYRDEVRKKLDEKNDFFIQLKDLEGNYKIVERNLNKLYIKYDEFQSVSEKNREFILKHVKYEKLEYEKAIKEIEANINIEKINKYKELIKSATTREELEINIQVKIKEKSIYEDIIKDVISLKTYYKDNKIFSDLELTQKKLDEHNKNQEILEVAKSDFQKLNDDIDSYIYNAIENKSEEYEEVISKFYRYLNPHENFNNLKIKVKRNKTQNNDLRFEIFNDKMKDKVVSPAYIFSSAQNNALAIAIFLSFALDSNWSKLESLFLDDPIQNMDDINIYAFTDLIKKISEKKQVFLSTHDDRVMEFMKMKLGKENIQIIEFNGYGQINN